MNNLNKILFSCNRIFNLTFLLIFFSIFFFTINTKLTAADELGPDKGLAADNFLIFKGVGSGKPGGWFMSDENWVRAYNDYNIATRGSIYIKGDLMLGKIQLDLPTKLESNFEVIDSLVCSYNIYINSASFGSVGDVAGNPLVDRWTEGTPLPDEIATAWVGFSAMYLTTWQHISLAEYDQTPTPSTAHGYGSYLNYSDEVGNDTSSQDPAHDWDDRGVADLAQQDRANILSTPNRERMDRRENFAIAQNPAGTRVLLNTPVLNYSNPSGVLNGQLSISIANSPRLLINPNDEKIGIGNPAETGTEKVKINGHFSLGDAYASGTNHLYLGERSTNPTGITYKFFDSNHSLVFFSNNQINFEENQGSNLFVKMDVSTSQPSILIRGTVQMSNYPPNWDTYLDFNSLSAWARDNAANGNKGYKSLHTLKPISIGTYKQDSGDPTPKARIYFNGINGVNVTQAKMMYLEKHQKDSTDYSELRLSLASSAAGDHFWEIGAVDDTGIADERGEYPPVDNPLVYFGADGDCGHVKNKLEPTDPYERIDHADDHGNTDPYAKRDSIKRDYFVFSRAFSANGNSIKASDARLKTAIEPLNYILDYISAIKGVSFSWKSLSEIKKDAKFPKILDKALNLFLNSKKDKAFQPKPKDLESKRHFGLIAQEVALYFPELIYLDNNGYQNLDYESLIPVLVQALKERQQSLDKIEAEISDLEEEINLTRKNVKRNK